jgi:hypothetical protein
VNEATFNDWLLCVGLAIHASNLNGLEFWLLFFQEKGGK